MYNFRYHLITICSIFIALALGLLLGAAIASSELIQSTSDDMVGSMFSRYETLVDDNNKLKQELQDSTALVSELSETWAEERLDGRTIVLLLGDAPEDKNLHNDLTQSIAQAGGSTVSVTVLRADFGFEDEEILSSLQEIVEEVPGEDYKQTIAQRLVKEWTYAYTTSSVEPVQEDFDIARYQYTWPSAVSVNNNGFGTENEDAHLGLDGGLEPATDFQKVIFDEYPLTRALLAYEVIRVDADYSQLIDRSEPSPPADKQAALKVARAWQLPYGVNGLVNGLAQQQDEAMTRTQIGVRLTQGIQAAGQKDDLNYPAWLRSSIPKSTSGNVPLPNYYTVLIQPSHLNGTMAILASENSLSCVTSPETAIGRYSVIALLTGAQAGIYGGNRPPESRFAPLPKDTSGRAVFR